MLAAPAAASQGGTLRAIRPEASSVCARGMGDLDNLARAARSCLRPAGRRGNETVLDREDGRSGTCPLTGLVVDVRQVVLNRARGEKQALGDLAVGQPARDHAKHLDLARTE